MIKYDKFGVDTVLQINEVFLNGCLLLSVCFVLFAHVFLLSFGSGAMKPSSES